MDPQPEAGRAPRQRGAVTAIVPLKALGRAKGRLAPALSAAARRDLALSMFTHVADVCRAASHVHRILVVAGDADGARTAAELGLPVVADPGQGLNAAVEAADRLVRDDCSVVVAADLPHATPGELDLLLEAAQRLRAAVGRIEPAASPVPTVLVVPTADGGTGALVRLPPRIVAPAFGRGSASRHLTAGRRAGAATGLVALPGLAHDVDRPGDLRVPVREGRPDGRATP